MGTLWAASPRSSRFDLRSDPHRLHDLIGGDVLGDLRGQTFDFNFVDRMFQQCAGFLQAHGLAEQFQGDRHGNLFRQFHTRQVDVNDLRPQEGPRARLRG